MRAIVLCQIGVALLAAALVLAGMSCPRVDEPELDAASWAASQRLPLSIAGEALTLGAIALSAGLCGFGMERRARRPGALIGFGAGACSIVLALAAMLAAGRLSYPIGTLGDDPAAISLVAAVWLSAVHALCVSAGIAVLGAAAGAGPALAAVRWNGVGAGLVLVAACFPWVAPAWLLPLAAMLAWGWCAMRLASIHPPTGGPSPSRS